jgi:hypothetical protein
VGNDDIGPNDGVGCPFRSEVYNALYVSSRSSISTNPNISPIDRDDMRRWTGSEKREGRMGRLTPGEDMNTSLPLILQDLVFVNLFPARILNRVDFPATHQPSPVLSTAEKVKKRHTPISTNKKAPIALFQL